MLKNLIDLDGIRTAKKALKMETEAAKKVVVTGGGGYIGSVLVAKLLEKNLNVTVLDECLYGNEGLEGVNGKPGFEFIKGNVLDAASVERAVAGSDAVIHLAAIVGEPAAEVNRAKTASINRMAAKTVAEACRRSGVERMLLASTCSVYGRSEEKTVDENSTPKPGGIYAETKFLAESEVLGAAADGFYPVILRLATVYGLSPRMRFDLIANKMIAEAAWDGRIVVLGGGGQWRPFVHVADVAKAFLECLRTPVEKVSSRIFNVGSDDQNYTMMALAEEVKKHFPHAALEVSEKMEDSRNYRVSFERIRRELGFVAKMTVADASHEIEKAKESGALADYRDAKYDDRRLLAVAGF